MQKYVFEGGTALITGAASGIGEALSRALAARGSNLILLDRDAERLEATASGLRRAHPDLAVHQYVVDLADADAVLRLAARIASEHPRISLLVNNAGVVLRGRFDQVTLEEFDWVMNINFRAVVLLTHALLPQLKARRGSHLVNISSVYGLVAPAGQCAYAASKFAVRGLTEVLRTELAEEGIGVTSVHPGGIRTRIAQSARVGDAIPRAELEEIKRLTDRTLTISPETAAAAIMAGIERRRKRVLIGWTAKAPDLLARLFPASYGTVLAASMKRAAHRPAR